MQPVKALAETVRANRQPVAPDNPLLAMEQDGVAWITLPADHRRQRATRWQRQMFLRTYGSPWLQALVGFGPDATGRCSALIDDLSARGERGAAAGGTGARSSRRAGWPRR